MVDHFIFRIGAGTWGFPTSVVQHTLPSVSTQLVPWMPAFHRGLFHVRGEILPLLDLRTFLNESASAPQTEPTVLMVNTGSFRFGTLVGTPRFISAPLDTLPLHPDASIYPALDAVGDADGQPYTLINPERLLIQITRQLHQNFALAS
jgi:chemotaxis signal transduction protein